MRCRCSAPAHRGLPRHRRAPGGVGAHRRGPGGAHRHRSRRREPRRTCRCREEAATGTCRNLQTRRPGRAHRLHLLGRRARRRFAAARAACSRRRSDDPDAEPVADRGRRRRPARRRVAVRARHRQHPAAVVRRLAAADRIRPARARPRSARRSRSTASPAGRARPSSTGSSRPRSSTSPTRASSRSSPPTSTSARTSSVTPLPDGSTIRTAAVLDADGLPTGRTSIARVAADGATTVLAETADTDAVHPGLRLAQRALRRGADGAGCRGQPLRHVPAAAARAPRDAHPRDRRRRPVVGPQRRRRSRGARCPPV